MRMRMRECYSTVGTVIAAALLHKYSTLSAILRASLVPRDTACWPVQNNLGVLYRSGTGVPIDYIAAVCTRSPDRG